MRKPARAGLELTATTLARSFLGNYVALQNQPYHCEYNIPTSKPTMHVMAEEGILPVITNIIQDLIHTSPGHSFCQRLTLTIIQNGNNVNVPESMSTAILRVNAEGTAVTSSWVCGYVSLIRLVE